MATDDKAMTAPKANVETQATKSAGEKSAAKAPEAKGDAPAPAVAAPVPATGETPVAAKPAEKRVEVATRPAPKPTRVAAKARKASNAVRKASDEAKMVVAKTAAKAARAAAPAMAAAETAAKTIRKPAIKDSKTMSAFEDSVNKTQAMFGDVNARAKAQFEKSAKLAEEMNAFAKGNVEALVESGKITAKGLETLGQDAADFTRKSFEKATATMKEMSAVKSPADFFKLQSDFVREQFDAVVAATSKNTEAMIKLAGDAAQPISSRYAVAVEKVKTAA